MAKSREYWNKRFEALENAQMNKGAAYFAELEKQYTMATSAVQSDIEKWYARFATNNEITMQEARKLLTSKELEEFKWNVMDYIEKGKTLNHSTQWAKQLENASAKFHISRLEALKMQMQNHVEVLYGNELDDFSTLMEKIYTEGYYHTAYEIQKGFNIGYSMMKLDKNKIEKVLSKPWAADGSNFSDRIWKQKSQLVSELHNNLTQSIIRGQNPSVVTDAIAKRFNVSKGQAGRLVMTESAFFASASNKDCYKDLGVEQYEILATLDTKTSDICQDMDGEVFDMKDYEIGVTAPPFHTWCRTTTVPYFNDEFELGTKRAARDDASGQTYYVPSNMKYEDWYKKYVANPSPSARIKVKKAPVAKSATKYKKENVSGVDCKVREQKYTFSNGTTSLDPAFERDAIVYELPDSRKFVIPKDLDATKQTMTIDKAIELYQRVPQNVRDNMQEYIEIVDYLNPQDAYWKQKYANFTQSYMIGGDQITIFQYTNHDEDYFVTALCHEAGHFIDKNVGGGSYYSMSAEWMKAMVDDEALSGKKSWRAYGENSNLEDFADAIAYYSTDQANFKNTFLNRTKLIEQILK